MVNIIIQTCGGAIECKHYDKQDPNGGNCLRNPPVAVARIFTSKSQLLTSVCHVEPDQSTSGLLLYSMTAKTNPRPSRGGLGGKNNISIKTTLLLIKRLLFYFTRN